MNTTSGIYFQLTQALQKEKLSLPSLPDIALKIRTAIMQPDVCLDDICNIVKIDAALNHYILKVANSPLFKGINAITTLKDALSRLGFVVTQNLVFSYSIKSLFKAKRSPARKQLDWVWQHSKKVSAMSATLATLCPKMQTDKALLAGLFENIGSLAVVQFLALKNQLPTHEQQLWDQLTNIADKAGTLILKSWNFDEDFCNVARFRQHWDGTGSDQLDYADLVLIAEALIKIPPHVTHAQEWFDRLPSRRKMAEAGFSITHGKLSAEFEQQYQQNLQLLSL